MFRKYSEEEYQMAIRELGAELADKENCGYNHNPAEIEEYSEEELVHVLDGSGGEVVEQELYDEESKRIMRIIHKELTPKELEKTLQTIYDYKRTGVGKSVFMENAERLKLSVIGATNAEKELSGVVQGLLAKIQEKLEEMSLIHSELDVKTISKKTSNAIKAYFMLMGIEQPGGFEGYYDGKGYHKYGEYKYPYKTKEKLSSEDVLEKVRNTPIKTEQDIIDTGVIDVLLEDAGVEILEKRETFKEMEARKWSEALKDSKELREKKNLSKMGWYPSVGYSPSELKALEGYSKHQAELRAQELSGKKKKTKDELERESLARAVDGVLSGSN